MTGGRGRALRLGDRAGQCQGDNVGPGLACFPGRFDQDSREARRQRHATERIEPDDELLFKPARQRVEPTVPIDASEAETEREEHSLLGRLVNAEDVAEGVDRQCSRVREARRQEGADEVEAVGVDLEQREAPVGRVGHEELFNARQRVARRDGRDREVSARGVRPQDGEPRLRELR